MTEIPRRDRLAEIRGELLRGHWDEDWAKEDIEWLIEETERLRRTLDDIEDAWQKLGAAPNRDIHGLAKAHLTTVLSQTFDKPAHD